MRCAAGGSQTPPAAARACLWSVWVVGGIVFAYGMAVWRTTNLAGLAAAAGLAVVASSLKVKLPPQQNLWVAGGSGRQPRL